MSKKLLSIIISSVVVLAIAVGAAFAFTGRDNSGAETSGSQEPSSTPTASATPEAPSGEEFEDSFSRTALLAAAEEIFTTAEATDNFSREDVLLALYTARQYATTAVNSPALLNGDWSTERVVEEVSETGETFSTTIPAFDEETVLGVYSNFFGEEFFAQYRTRLDALRAGNNPTAENQVFAFTPWYPQADTKLCGEGSLFCQVEGYPIFSDSLYEEDTAANAITVEFTVESRLQASNNGAEGYVPLNLNYRLSLTPNEAYTEAIGEYPFIIQGLSNEYELSTFVAN